MKISVIAHPKSSQQKIVLLNSEENPQEKIYHVYVHSVPDKGKANKEIIKLLSKYFKTAKSNIQLISGTISKKKIFEINI